MHVSVCQANGDKSLELEVNPRISFAFLKKQIAEQWKVPPLCQTLLLGLDTPADSERLANVCMDGESLSLTLVISLKELHKVLGEGGHGDIIKALECLPELGVKGDDQLVAAVAAHLVSEKEDIQRAAVEAMRVIAEKHDQRVIGALTANLDRLSANAPQEGWGPDGLPNAPRRPAKLQGALEALGVFAERGSDEIVTAVVAHLADNVGVVRCKVLRVLKEIAEKGNVQTITAASALLQNGEDRSRSTRLAALELLGVVGERGSEQAIAAGVACLEDQETDVRCAAVELLSAIAEKGDERVVPALNSHVDDQDEVFRQAVMTGLFRMAAIPEDAWSGLPIAERLLDALAQVPTAEAPAKAKETWLQVAADDLHLLASSAYRSALCSAPPMLIDPLLMVLSANHGLVAELSIPMIGLLHAALLELGKGAVLKHPTWSPLALAAASALPKVLQRQVARNRPREALPALEFILCALGDSSGTGGEEAKARSLQPTWVDMCHALLNFVSAIGATTNSSSTGGDVAEMGTWLLNTHARRAALETLTLAPIVEIHDSLLLLLRSADEASRSENGAAREELAADCLAAILGQNATLQPLLGDETTTLVFVAMHTTATSAGYPHAWCCWVLPSLERAVSGNANAATTHALGVAGSLCGSHQVGQASGPGALSDLLSAIERVARSESTRDLHELANDVGARVYKLYQRLRTPAGRASQENGGSK